MIHKIWRWFLSLSKLIIFLFFDFVILALLELFFFIICIIMMGSFSLLLFRVYNFIALLLCFLEFRRSFDSSYRRYLFLEFIFNFAPFPDKESGCKAFLSIGSLLSIFYFTQVAGFRAWYLFYWNQFLCEIFILMKCFWQPFPYFGEPWTPLCSLFYYYLFLNQKI